MNDPYEVLGLPHDADEAAIRSRYLELVRAHPPERDAQRFGEIRDAYDRLRDPIACLEQRLFSPTSTQTFDGLLAQMQPDVRRSRVPTEVLLSLARP
jgi:preprotein translocase subunit Sec63